LIATAQSKGKGRAQRHKGNDVLTGLMTIALFDVAGDLLQTVMGLPIPGPVIGMALLLVGLVVRGRLPAELERTSTTLLSYLPMLFVPAGVGVMAHFDLIRADWLAIAVAILLSSLLTIVVTATTMRGIERMQETYRASRRRRSVAPVMEPAE
jgi:holin-like protein